eukprot:3051547-Pleurochrysis_carterae.AAC.1
MARTPITARSALSGGTCTMPKCGATRAPTQTALTPACHLEAFAGIRFSPPQAKPAGGHAGGVTVAASARSRAAASAAAMPASVGAPCQAGPTMR